MLEIGLLQKPLPGLMAQVFGASNDAPQFPTPSFYAPLKTTIVPSFGSGSLTPTFTRASIATEIDFEGRHFTALSGEARMMGARRVHNRLLKTEALENAAWT